MVIHDPPIQGSFLRAMKRLGNGWKTKKGQELFSDFGWCEFPSEWKRSGETKTAKTLPSGNGGFFPCDFCDSDFWGGFFKRRGKPTGQCLYRETDFSCPNIAENPRVGKFPLKTSLEHNQKLFIYRWLFPMAVWKKSSPWNTDVASYVSLLHWLLTNPYPKKCLVENFLYKHWNQKKITPPEQKNHPKFSCRFNSDATFFGVFFLSEVLGSKLLERNGDPKRRGLETQTGPPWGLRCHVRCKDTSLRDVTFIMA